LPSQPTQIASHLLAADEDPWSDLETDHVAEGDYYTHRAIIEAAREAMGGIDLDPASCRDANEVVQATRFFSFRENGLLHEWSGRVWLNPPFGNWQEWVPKTVAEWRSGRIEQMCVLCESRVTTAKMFHPLVREASAVVVMCGRYAFWGPNASMPDEGHAIFYFGKNARDFRDAFSLIGTTFERMA
jgi:DNA N-6-adenine-methyltransferase Dam